MALHGEGVGGGTPNLPSEVRLGHHWQGCAREDCGS